MCSLQFLKSFQFWIPPRRSDKGSLRFRLISSLLIVIAVRRLDRRIHTPLPVKGFLLKDSILRITLVPEEMRIIPGNHFAGPNKGRRTCLTKGLHGLTTTCSTSFIGSQEMICLLIQAHLTYAIATHTQLLSDPQNKKDWTDCLSLYPAGRVGLLTSAPGCPMTRTSKQLRYRFHPRIFTALVSSICRS